jgi:DNA-binding winged helix-turn-helix (wHTH) protein
LVATPANAARSWRFGLFEVDAQKEELRRGGVPIKIREQPYRILVFLLEKAGEIVTREDLRRVLWPADTFVDFDHSLNTAVMKLREALGDIADKPLYIETVPKRGYRFIAPVSMATDAACTPQLSSSIGTAPQTVSGESRAAEGFWVAVLPFKYTGASADLKALAEGISDEVITGRTARENGTGDTDRPRAFLLSPCRRARINSEIP